MVMVQGAGVEIATQDRGGDGIPLLLTHGYFGDQSHLDPLARRLTPEFRVVTFDMRNHGASGEGEWTWAAVGDDITAVIEYYGLDRPVLGGHSLGGMVAVLYAEAGGDARGVVNLDGHGMGRPEQYVGMSAEEAGAALTRLREVQSSLNAPPSPALAAMMPVVESLYMFDHYEHVRCPQLIFNATGPDPMLTNVEALAWAAPLMAAYRAGLVRDFAALTAAHPTIEVETMDDAAHYLIFTHADQVAERIARFASSEMMRVH